MKWRYLNPILWSYPLYILLLMSVRVMASGPAYHETQRRLCCGTHTLNNLYQHHWIDTATMDRLASALGAADKASSGQHRGSGWLESALRRASDPFAPTAYRSLVPGLGSYDVSVLVEALKMRNARFGMHVLKNGRLEEDLAVLHARLSGGAGRGPEATEDEGRGERAIGVILNRKSRTWAARWLLEGRHWLALIPWPSGSAASGGEQIRWWMMDSKLPAPVLVGGAEHVVASVREAVCGEEGQAFLVVEAVGAGERDSRGRGVGGGEESHGGNRSDGE